MEENNRITGVIKNKTVSFGAGSCVIFSFTNIKELCVFLRKRKNSSLAFLCIDGYVKPIYGGIG